MEIDVAAKAVTDGFNDNGLDAIFFDQNNDALILVQSKWSADGTKPIDADGTGAMATGVRDLFAARFDRFNDCQSAFKFDPVSASNFDPFERRVLTVALVSVELVGIAETRRARVA